MTDTNTFNFENYGQEQTGFFGATEENAQFINANESPMDPSAYYQGDNAVLQETAGFGENVDFSNQNPTTFNPDSLDSNAIFGQTLQTETVVPDSFGQTFQDTTTTTTNAIEGNNYFDTSNQIQTLIHSSILLILIAPQSSLKNSQSNKQQQPKQIHILGKLKIFNLNLVKLKFSKELKPINFLKQVLTILVRFNLRKYKEKIYMEHIKQQEPRI